MSEPQAPPALYQSVFARLLAIMLVMGACLLGMVSGFYFLIIIPGIHQSLDSLVGLHARAIAESHPDSTTARSIARRLDLRVRYEGPDGTWASDPNVPSLAGLEHLAKPHGLAHLRAPRNTYYIVRTNQGSYVFERTFGANLGHAHDQMLMILLLMMVGVFATAYLVLRRALRPLRLLGAGVAQLGDGRLDVVVPKQSHDEFGVLTDAFNRMVRRVRDMVGARDQLLLDVSHELRSPLTRMKVALEMMPDSPSRQSMAADVVEMEAMVTELLELERLRDGRGVRRERHDLMAIVRDIADRYRDRSPGVRGPTRTDAAGGDPTAWLDLDADRVRVVLRNLIENALKFSLPDSRPVEIDVAQEADGTVVRVRDDGLGIPEGDPNRLFEPFYRSDPSRSRKTGGYGLGLSICKRIMEAHGGSIRVERHDGRGVTFVLRFPT